MSNCNLKINDKSVPLVSIINEIKSTDQGHYNKLVEPFIIRIMALENNISVSKEELQKAVDEMRYMLSLEKVEDLNEYLSFNNVSLNDFMNGVESILLKSKLVENLSESEVIEYISENQTSMEKAEIYSMRLEDENTANEIKSLLEEEENFLALAQENSLDTDTAKMGGYIGYLGRDEMTSEIEAAVFSASEGDIIGPVKTDEGYNLFLVRSFIKPDKNNSEFLREMKLELFEQILNEKVMGAQSEITD